MTVQNRVDLDNDYPLMGDGLLGMLRDAIDLASDQGQRTWLMDNGKRVAMIVTVDDGERLERSEALCICPAGEWLDSCPLHGHPGKLPIVVTSAQADKLMLEWSARGRPYHQFAGDPDERWCRICAGGPGGIQHRST